LKKYKDAYYNKQPIVSDAAYDALEDELRDLDPDNEIFGTVGAPVSSHAGPSRNGIRRATPSRWARR
ncbi:MAG TPA: hypothetical protein VGH87_02590, partial [Polyangiaceae bacterium]